MLKIKDKDDLKKFEEFGFRIKYNVDTGEPCELVKEKHGCFCEVVATMSFKFTNSKIWSMSIKTKDKYDYYLEYWADTIYDLTKAGLIEKGEK